MLSQEVFLLELYSRSQAAAMLGITVRKLDMLRANRLIGYYLPSRVWLVIANQSIGAYSSIDTRRFAV